MNDKSTPKTAGIPKRQFLGGLAMAGTAFAIPTRRTIQYLAVMGMAGLCLPAFAQDSELNSEESVPAAEPGALRVLPITAVVGGSRQFNTSIDNGGNFSVNRYRAAVGVPIRLNDQFVIAGGVTYQMDSYDFGGGFNGWGYINTLTVSAMVHYRHDEHWAFYGGPIVRTAAEGTDWSNATEGGGALAANYIFNDKLRIGGGLVVIGQIEDDAQVMPILTANWKFADDWQLKVGFADLATAGYGARVTWDFAPKFEWSFDAQSRKSRFRTQNSSFTSGGVGEESAITLTTGITWSPCKCISATGFVGVAAAGHVQSETSNGIQLRNDTYDAAPVLGARVNFVF